MKKARSKKDRIAKEEIKEEIREEKKRIEGEKEREERKKKGSMKNHCSEIQLGPTILTGKSHWYLQKTTVQKIALKNQRKDQETGKNNCYKEKKLAFFIPQTHRNMN